MSTAIQRAPAPGPRETRSRFFNIGTVLQAIRLEGARLKVGETSNEIRCPFCDGGSSKDTNFYITRKRSNEAAYKCHRLSCSRAGYVALGPAASDINISRTDTFTPNPYVGETWELGDVKIKYLEERYGLTKELLDGARFIETNNGLGMPVYGPTGACRGLVTRSRGYSGGKKIVRFFQEVDEPWMCWYRKAKDKSKTLVILEDQLSALRLSSVFQTIALLGTGLQEEKVDEIRARIMEGEISQIIVSLDKDATAKAIGYLQEYKHLLRNYSSLFLSKDVKDMSSEEFQRYIANVEVPI